MYNFMIKNLLVKKLKQPVGFVMLFWLLAKLSHCSYVLLLDTYT